MFKMFKPFNPLLNPPPRFAGEETGGGWERFESIWTSWTTHHWLACTCRARALVVLKRGTIQGPVVTISSFAREDPVLLSNGKYCRIGTDDGGKSECLQAGKINSIHSGRGTDHQW